MLFNLLLEFCNKVVYEFTQAAKTFEYGTREGFTLDD